MWTAAWRDTIGLKNWQRREGRQRTMCNRKSQRFDNNPSHRSASTGQQTCSMRVRQVAWLQPLPGHKRQSLRTWESRCCGRGEGHVKACLQPRPPVFGGGCFLSCHPEMFQSNWESQTVWEDAGLMSEGKSAQHQPLTPRLPHFKILIWASWTPGKLQSDLKWLRSPKHNIKPLSNEPFLFGLTLIYLHLKKLEKNQLSQSGKTSAFILSDRIIKFLDHLSLHQHLFLWFTRVKWKPLRSYQLLPVAISLYDSVYLCSQPPPKVQKHRANTASANIGS